MLDVTNAKQVIDQLQNETFLCSEDTIVTNNYIIIKKTNEITSGKVHKALKQIHEGCE